MFEIISKNLLQIQEEIAPLNPRIIAVTKYFDKNAMIEAYKAGLRDFAESRVIEASAKIMELPDEIRQNSEFHFIGHLQSNKVKQVVKFFDYIHSVDSLKLAELISKNAIEQEKVQKVLLQINNANEEQKFGFSVEEIFEIFSKIVELPNIEVVGLMNMAPLGASDRELERLFSQIVEIRDRLESGFSCNLKEISMGMSQDYRIAAQKGSTMLRIGRKLFKL